MNKKIVNEMLNDKSAILAEAILKKAEKEQEEMEKKVQLSIILSACMEAGNFIWLIVERAKYPNQLELIYNDICDLYEDKNYEDLHWYIQYIYSQYRPHEELEFLYFIFSDKESFGLYMNAFIAIMQECLAIKHGKMSVLVRSEGEDHE